MTKPKILISVLNWNNSTKTIHCVSSLLSELENSSYDATLIILDNGSIVEDYAVLLQRITHPKICIERNEKNLGFTGGHNFSIQKAFVDKYDYIWLLNNDAAVEPGALAKLISAFDEDPKCGAASPVIAPEKGGPPIAAWGGTHNWETRTINWAKSKQESLYWHTSDAANVCVAGTAIIFRVAALKRVGLLDDRLFAYFDDNDIGTRLAAAGWTSKVVFDATVSHEWRKIEEQPDYFFYLMYRNELIFWTSNWPTRNKIIPVLKLLNQSIFNVNRLYRKGRRTQADAALLGVNDFIIKKYGSPELNRRIPKLMNALRLIVWILNLGNFKMAR